MITTQQELEAALAVGGDIVCDSSVTITLTDAMQVTRPSRILGGHFYRASGAGFEIRSSDVEINGATFDGGGISAGYDNTQRFIHAIGTASNPLYRIRVFGCTFHDSRGHNIWLSWCRDSAIYANAIYRFLYSGIMVISGSDITIVGNTVADSALSPGVVNVYGIAITDLDNTSAARSHHVSITGNTISRIDWEGIDTHGGYGLAITGNVITGCRRGIALVTGNNTRLYAPTDIAVTGNSVDGSGARVALDTGIILAGAAYKPASATITGNDIIGYERPITPDNYGRGDTHIGGNSTPQVPWSGIVLSADFTANSTYTPQYLVDGDVVQLRGGVIPKAGGIKTHTDVGQLPNSSAWPSVLTPLSVVKGSNAAAGIGTLCVTPEGMVRILYGTGTDSYTYFLGGSYRTI